MICLGLWDVSRSGSVLVLSKSFKGNFDFIKAVVYFSFLDRIGFFSLGFRMERYID